MAKTRASKSVPESVQGQLAATVQERSWLEKYWPIFATVVGVTATIGMGVLGWLIMGVSWQLREIQEHAKKIAVLEPLLVDVRDLRGEIQAVASKADDRAMELNRRVALLESLPEQMKALSSQVAAARDSTNRAVEETQALAAKVPDVTRDMNELKTAIARTQAQFDQLQSIGANLESARRTLESASASGRPQFTATLRVPLRDGEELPPSGRFQRVAVTLEATDVPVFSEQRSLAQARILSAELRAQDRVDPVGQVTVIPRLEASTGRIHLVIWYAPETKLMPLSTYVLLLSVSLPAGP